MDTEPGWCSVFVAPYGLAAGLASGLGVVGVVFVLTALLVQIRRVEVFFRTWLEGLEAQAKALHQHWIPSNLYDAYVQDSDIDEASKTNKSQPKKEVGEEETDVDMPLPAAAEKADEDGFDPAPDGVRVVKKKKKKLRVHPKNPQYTTLRDLFAANIFGNEEEFEYNAEETQDDASLQLPSHHQDKTEKVVLDATTTRKAASPNECPPISSANDESTLPG